MQRLEEALTRIIQELDPQRIDWSVFPSTFQEQDQFFPPNVTIRLTEAVESTTAGAHGPPPSAAMRDAEEK
jgi:hypothetical protein